MASNIGEFRTKVQSRIQDGQASASGNPAAPKLTVTPAMTSDVDLCILSSREEYEKARPLSNVVVLTGNGTKRLSTKLLKRSLGGNPVAWATFNADSSIPKIIYPFDITKDDPDALEADQYHVVQRSDDLYLEFVGLKPAATQQLEVTFTTPHVLDADHCTINGNDDEAFADLCAAYCCEKLAAYFRQTGDASVQADSVNYISKGREYSDQAKVFRASYKAKMFAPTDGTTQPASAVGFFDTLMGNDADRYFSHGRRFR